MAKLTIICKGCGGRHGVTARTIEKKFPLRILTNQPYPEQKRPERKSLRKHIPLAATRTVGFLCVKCSIKQEVANRQKGTGWRPAFKELIETKKKERAFKQ